jgi:hypothetical protein
MPKIAVMALLCAAIAVAACRREEAVYRPLKLGGPIMDQPKPLDGLSSKRDHGGADLAP